MEGRKPRGEDTEAGAQETRVQLSEKTQTLTQEKVQPQKIFVKASKRDFKRKTNWLKISEKPCGVMWYILNYTNELNLAGYF
jgi:hypothetical protein